MDIKQLRTLYNEWASRKIDFKDLDNYIEIKTPFVDMNHDYIYLFLTKNNDSYSLGDDGYIVDELETLGIDIGSSPKRSAFFDQTLKIFGINFNKATLELSVTFNNLSEYPVKQHQLIQCMIRVSDMLMTSRQRVTSFFTEDIENFLLDHDIPFNMDFSHLGRSGNNISFDFIIGQTRKTKPKLIKAVNTPTSEAYRIPLLSILDVRDLLSNYEYYVIANDTTKISDKFISSFTNYDTTVLKWTERDAWVGKLKAI